MPIRKPFSYDRKKASLEARTPTTGVSRTQQQFRDDVDINTLVRRFGITGELPVARNLPEYGDFTEVTDFQTAMQSLRRSQETFDALPAALRDRFQNDPARLLHFLGSEDNREEARKLGLLRPEPLPEPEVPSTPPPGSRVDPDPI